jgi:beta-glucanase (GH16 family)
MRRWRLALAAAVALGIAVWAVGFAGSHAVPTGLGQAAGRLPSFAKLAREAAAKGAITPIGPPEFSATFTSGKLDNKLWATCYPWMDGPSGCRNFGSAPEYEWYLPSQVSISGQTLALRAEQVPTSGLNQNGQPQEYSCRSGMVTTYPGFRFEYGYIQVEAWIPESLGLWPAIWLAAANEKWPPEMDLLESWGNRFQAAVYFHAVGAAVVGNVMHPGIPQGWHTIALSWTKSQLTYFIDGKEFLTAHQRIPAQQMYFIVDLAEWQPPSTPAYCSGQLLIRSIKVWRV